jgi:hypothetical protein
VVYDGELGGVTVLASVIGLYGTLRNEAEAAFGDSDWWGIQGGAMIDLFGFQLAGSIASDHVGDTRRDFFNAGVGYGYGPLSTSITYGRIFSTNDDYEEVAGIGDSAYNLVFSATYALAPGLALQGDVAMFDNDATDATLADTGTGDQGWTGVARLEVSF